MRFSPPAPAPAEEEGLLDRDAMVVVVVVSLRV